MKDKPTPHPQCQYWSIACSQELRSSLQQGAVVSLGRRVPR